MYHFAASTYGAVLSDTKLAWRIWHRMRATFPHALSACIMPNHIHLISAREDDEDTFRSLLTGYSAVRWKPFSAPSKIKNSKKLLADWRYVALNPCRDGLARDPLEWPWSTYRGVFSLVANPWVKVEALAPHFKTQTTDFLDKLHRHVSNDVTVAIGGTRFPSLSIKQEPQLYSLHRIRLATLAATESHESALTKRGSRARKLFIDLSRECGWHSSSRVARALGITEQSVSALRGRCPKSWIDAGLRCLADDRLSREQSMRKLPPYELVSSHPTLLNF